MLLVASTLPISSVPSAACTAPGTDTPSAVIASVVLFIDVVLRIVIFDISDGRIIRDDRLISDDVRVDPELFELSVADSRHGEFMVRE